MRTFTSFKAAAAYARRQAQAGHGATRIARDGDSWLVESKDESAAIWHPELDRIQRDEGRRRLELEIDETRAYLESLDDQTK